MDAPTDLPDLSPGRIGRLSKWAQVAFAARCAFRTLPAFLPPRPSEDVPDSRRTELTAANACCWIALQASVTGSGRYREIATRALQRLVRNYRGPTGNAGRCVSVATEMVAIDDPEELLDSAMSCLASYNDVAGTSRVYDEFQSAADEDLKALERLDHSGGKEAGDRAPLAFFQRPLFRRDGEIPAKYQPVVEDWRHLLDELAITDLYNVYMLLCPGTRLGQDDATLVIDAWLAFDRAQKTSSTPSSSGDVVIAFPASDAPDKPTPESVVVPPPVSEAPAPRAPVLNVPPPLESWAPVTQVESAARTPPPAAPANVPPPTPAPTPQPTRPDEWMVADRPLERDFKEQDRFQFKDYADALAAILDHERTETPFTIAINAPWGTGKTTLANMIAEQLEQRPRDRGQPPHIICRFNAWMNDDAPNLATAFVSVVGRTADRHRRWYWRVIRPLPLAMLEPSARTPRRLLWWGSVLTLMLLSMWLISEHLKHVQDQKAFEAAKVTPYQSTETTTTDASGKSTSRSVSEAQNRSRPAVPIPIEPIADVADPLLLWFQSRMELLGAFFTAVAGIVGAVLPLLGKVWTATSLSGFVQSPEKAAEAGAVQSARAQMRRLIDGATWQGNRLVVFVDDIERCTPPRSIDVMDAISQLMDHKGVVVVLLGDMSAVAAAAQLKYKDLAEIYVPAAGVAQTGPDRGKEAFGRLYLQKIVQFQFDLPIPPKETIHEYMGDLAVARAVVEGERNARSA